MTTLPEAAAYEPSRELSAANEPIWPQDQLSRLEFWAARFREASGRAVESIIESGRVLIEAKSELKHGEWLQFVETIGVGKSMAGRLMKVARHSVLSNPAHGPNLPPAWRTLYELTKLSNERLEDLIETGTIHPGVERKDVYHFLTGPELPVSEKPPAPGRVELYNEPCVKALERDEFFDWIITDPPYSKDSLGLYKELGEVSKRVLKPGGSLLCMSGQSYLPDVMNVLCAYLAYHWTLAYLTPGGQSAQIFPRRINTFWKPVLWFVKGTYEGSWIGDVTRSDVNDNDKRFHRWGQSESGMADLVGRFIREGDRVLDPFMGAGTTGVVATALGAHFGADRMCYRRATGGAA